MKVMPSGLNIHVCIYPKSETLWQVIQIANTVRNIAEETAVGNNPNRQMV